MPKINIFGAKKAKKPLLARPKQASPLDSVEYTNNVAEDAKREFTALELAFKEQAKAEKKTQEYANDTEFWVCVCFQSREQVEEFLEKSNFHKDLKYISGVELAEKFGITLNKYPEPTRSRKGLDKTLTTLT